MYLEAVCLGSLVDVLSLASGGGEEKQKQNEKVYKEALGKAQRAIRLDPGRLVGWRTLAYLKKLGGDLGVLKGQLVY